MAVSPLLAALGLGGATLGGAAALHGAGLADILSPLDLPRKSLYNTFAAPYRALESGDASQLLGAIPGVSGAILGGVLGGGPLGVLAGSALGGVLQGAGEATGKPQFEAPSVSDITGTEDFWPNLLVGAATDPLMYSGLAGSWRVAKPAAGLAKEAEQAAMAGKVAKTAEAIPEAIPLAKVAEDVPVAKFAEEMPKSPLQVPVAKTPDQLTPVFYSRLEKAIENLPNKQLLNEEELKALLDRASKKTGGYSKEEVSATGLYDIFATKPEVTKQELMDHFLQNQVTVKESIKGKGVVDPNSWRISKKSEGMLFPQEGPFPTEAEALLRKEQMFAGSGDLPEGYTARDIRFGAGGRNTTPGIEIRNLQGEVVDRYAIPEGQTKESVIRRFRNEKLGETTDPEMFVVENSPVNPRFAHIAPEGGENYREITFSTKPKEGTGTYKEPHWPGEENVFAHVRFQDRTGPNGEKILHAFEFQSQAHQEAKELGYRTTKSALEEKNIVKQIEALDEEMARIPQPEDILGSPGEVEAKKFDELFKKRQELTRSLYADPDPGKIPDLPFKTDAATKWNDLAMKRLARYAAENGYDGISIGRGEEINRLLGSVTSSKMGQIKNYGTDIPTEELAQFAKLHADQTVNPAIRQANRGRPYYDKIDKTSEEHLYKLVSEGELTKTDVDLYLGKLDPMKHAEKIKADATLPNMLKKYAKQYGIEVMPTEAIPVAGNKEALIQQYRSLNQERMSISDPDRINQIWEEMDKVHAELQRIGNPPQQLGGAYMPLNQKLRQDVLFKGQPLMNLGPLAGGASGSALLAALYGNTQS